MKIYANKLYSIPDAAQKAGIPEIAIVTMIVEKFINRKKIQKVSQTYFIEEKDIPGLKGKWIEYQRILNIGKGGKEKKLKKIPLTILRMDKGD